MARLRSTQADVSGADAAMQDVHQINCQDISNLSIAVGELPVQRTR